MSSNSPKWADIISAVERANLEESKFLKNQQRALRRKYAEHANEQLARNQFELNNQKMSKLEQRWKMEQDAINEQNLQKITKEMKLMKQKQYNKKNFEIVQSHKKGTKQEASIFAQHPFARLADQQQNRKKRYRQNLLNQVEVNKLQEKIRLKEMNDRKSSQKQQKQIYSNYVQAFYQRNNKDRNIFKRKYLQITNPQKINLLPVSNLSTIEKQYQHLNMQITKRAYLSNREKDQMDKVMSEINKKIQIPDSSPAFLGRIPMNSDRRKQLDYLQKSVNQNSNTKRVKTQGDHQLACMSQKRPTKNIPEFFALQRYYNKMKTQQNTEVTKEKVQSFHKRNTVNDLRNDSLILREQKVSEIREKPTNEVRKKVFSTYDIIQNQKKYVYL